MHLFFWDKAADSRQWLFQEYDFSFLLISLSHIHDTENFQWTKYPLNLEGKTRGFMYVSLCFQTEYLSSWWFSVEDAFMVMNCHFMYMYVFLHNCIHQWQATTTHFSCFLWNFIQFYTLPFWVWICIGFCPFGRPPISKINITLLESSFENTRKSFLILHWGTGHPYIREKK